MTHSAESNFKKKVRLIFPSFGNIYLYTVPPFLIVRIESYLGGIIFKGQPVSSIDRAGCHKSILSIKAHVQGTPAKICHLGGDHFCTHLFILVLQKTGPSIHVYVVLC